MDHCRPDPSSLDMHILLGICIHHLWFMSHVRTVQYATQKYWTSDTREQKVSGVGLLGIGCVSAVGLVGWGGGGRGLSLLVTHSSSMPAVTELLPFEPLDALRGQQIFFRL